MAQPLCPIAFPAAVNQRRHDGPSWLATPLPALLQVPAWPSLAPTAPPSTACDGTQAVNTCCCQHPMTQPFCCTTCATQANRCTNWRGMHRLPGALLGGLRACAPKGLVLTGMQPAMQTGNKVGIQAAGGLVWFVMFVQKRVCHLVSETWLVPMLRMPAGSPRSISPALWLAVTPWSRAVNAPNCSPCTALARASQSAGAMRA